MFDLIPPDVCPDDDNVLKLHSSPVGFFFFSPGYFLFLWFQFASVSICFLILFW